MGSGNKWSLKAEIILNVAHDVRLYNWSKYIFALSTLISGLVMWFALANEMWKEVTCVPCGEKSYCLVPLSSLFSFYYEIVTSQIGAAMLAWVLEWKWHETELQPIPSAKVTWVRNFCGCKPLRSWGYLLPQHNLAYTDWCTQGNGAGNMLVLTTKCWKFRLSIEIFSIIWIFALEHVFH